MGLWLVQIILWFIFTFVKLTKWQENLPVLLVESDCQHSWWIYSLLQSSVWFSLFKVVEEIHISIMTFFLSKMSENPFHRQMKWILSSEVCVDLRGQDNGAAKGTLCLNRQPGAISVGFDRSLSHHYCKKEEKNNCFLLCLKANINPNSCPCHNNLHLPHLVKIIQMKRPTVMLASS